MESFLKKVCEKRGDAESHKYFIRFGRGKYEKRFLLSATKGSKLKIKASFELANDFVKFAKELGANEFTGKVLSKTKIPGMNGRKKAGVFAYEVKNSELKEFEDAYYTLVDCNNGEIKLRIKKALPKPGKDAEKVDDGFCLMELDLKFWDRVKESFFWDMPDGRKIEIEHILEFKDIALPKNEKDPIKIRENAIRKGTITRRCKVDNKEFEKKYDVEA